MTDDDLTEMKTDEGKVEFDVKKENPNIEDLHKASEEAVEKLKKSG